jgi:hypothetical protein
MQRLKELLQDSELHRWRVWCNRSYGPLFPSGLVSQHLDENASYHGASLKGAMFCRVSLIEIGEGNAVGSFVCELVRGRAQFQSRASAVV